MAGTRQRIIDATAELMARQGYEATAMKEIVAAARAPFGSVYHFFPGGKEELGVATIRHSGTEYGRLIPAIIGSAPDLVTGVAAFFAGAADHLVETDYADACPIATIALEVSSVSEPLRQACASVFEEWIDEGVSLFVQRGTPPDQARRLVVQLVALLEGAFVLARAARSTEALELAGTAAVAAVRAALAGGRPPD